MDVINGGFLVMGGIPDPLSVNQIRAKSGPLKIGSATSGHGLTATNDLLIAGKLEVDGGIYSDSAVKVYNSTNQRSVIIDSADAASGNPAGSIQAKNDAETLTKDLVLQPEGNNIYFGGRIHGLNNGDILLRCGSASNVKIEDNNGVALISAGLGDDILFQPKAMANASEIGQGTTDTDISYIALRNASGTLCYIYPDAAGTGITVSTTKP